MVRTHSQDSLVTNRVLNEHSLTVGNRSISRSASASDVLKRNETNSVIPRHRYYTIKTAIRSLYTQSSFLNPVISLPKLCYIIAVRTLCGQS